MLRGGWARHPDVLAELTGKPEFRDIRRGNQDIHAKRHFVALSGSGILIQDISHAGTAGSKPSPLVKLRVIGKVAFWYQRKKSTAFKDRSHIVKFSFIKERHADHAHDRKLAGLLHYSVQCRMSAPNQCRLVKEVRRGIRRKHQLRKYNQRRLTLCCLANVVDNRAGIILCVRHLDFRCCCRDTHISFYHKLLPPTIIPAARMDKYADIIAQKSCG